MARVAFLQNIWAEWLGVMGLSAVLKQRGHQVAMFLGRRARMARELARFQPDVIALSAMNIQHQWLGNITSYLRAQGFRQRIIVGGPHPTFAPDSVLALPGVDAVCRGEGEGALPEFVEAVAAGADTTRIPNLWVKTGAGGPASPGEVAVVRNAVRPPLADLDALPFPDRALYSAYRYFRHKPFDSFQAGRGCPHDCTFCFNHQMRRLYPGAANRRRSPEKVVEEVVRHHRTSPIRCVYFEDSTLNLDREWFLAFCRLYGDADTPPMTCNVRLHLLDEEMARALVHARCASARFAVESGNEELRNTVLGKTLTDRDILAGTALLRRFGIRYTTSNMMGLPGETAEMAWQTVLLNRRIAPDFVDMLVFMPYPELELTRYAQRRGYLAEDSFEEMTRGRRRMFSSVLRQPEIREVCNLHKFSVLCVRSSSLDPLVRRLIRLPENRVFDAVFGVSYVVENCRRKDIRYSLGRMMWSVFKNVAEVW